jgi:peptide/nickel transport system substrate-binding protein
MHRAFQGVAGIGTVLIMTAVSGPAFAQKPGGILRLSHFDSPASVSILEEATRAAVQPMMGVFNNLVLYDQHIAQSSLDTVVPDLARKSWYVNVEQVSTNGDWEVTFHLKRPAVRPVLFYSVGATCRQP